MYPYGTSKCTYVELRLTQPKRELRVAQGWNNMWDISFSHSHTAKPIEWDRNTEITEILYLYNLSNLRKYTTIFDSLRQLLRP